MWWDRTRSRGLGVIWRVPCEIWGVKGGIIVLLVYIMELETYCMDGNVVLAIDVFERPL